MATELRINYFPKGNFYLLVVEDARAGWRTSVSLSAKDAIAMADSLRKAIEVIDNDLPAREPGGAESSLT
jgi:hypothetical protein